MACDVVYIEVVIACQLIAELHVDGALHAAQVVLYAEEDIFTAEGDLHKIEFRTVCYLSTYII